VLFEATHGQGPHADSSCCLRSGAVKLLRMAGHKELLQEFQEFSLSAANAERLMQHICDRLHETKSRYNWIGFYLLDKNDPTVLVVAPYTGSFTPNVRVPVDRGLCGAAASTGMTVVADDVSKDPRYLVGTDMVKSEMTVPMFAGKKLVGVLDAESYFLATFNTLEKDLVEACAAIVGRYFEKNPF